MWTLVLDFLQRLKSCLISIINLFDIVNQIIPWTFIDSCCQCRNAISVCEGNFSWKKNEQEMEEYKCSWTCAGAYLLLWLAPGRLFPGNQILQCAIDIAVHLWYPRTLTVHIP